MVVITRGDTGGVLYFHYHKTVPRDHSLCWYVSAEVAVVPSDIRFSHQPLRAEKYEVDVYGRKHKPVGSSGTGRHHERLND